MRLLSGMMKIPWGIAMLIGGGLAIASSFKSTGLVVWIGDTISRHVILLVLLVLFPVFRLSVEINFNTATTAVFLPVLAGMWCG